MKKSLTLLSSFVFMIFMVAGCGSGSGEQNPLHGDWTLVTYGITNDAKINSSTIQIANWSGSVDRIEYESSKPTGWRGRVSACPPDQFKLHSQGKVWLAGGKGLDFKVFKRTKKPKFHLLRCTNCDELPVSIAGVNKSAVDFEFFPANKDYEKFCSQ